MLYSGIQVEGKRFCKGVDRADGVCYTVFNEENGVAVLFLYTDKAVLVMNKILIVEDDAVIRAQLKTFLEKHGYQGLAAQGCIWAEAGGLGTQGYSNLPVKMKFI
jgi:hypothetical protein